MRFQDMSILSIVIISALGGSIVTGGAVFAIQSKKQTDSDNVALVEAIGGLETKFEEAQASAVTNLTEPDLLKVPCSAEFIKSRTQVHCCVVKCSVE
jgi:hypothetical protein